MEFLKKHGVKLFFCVIFLIGFVLTVMNFVAALAAINATGFNLVPNYSKSSLNAAMWMYLAMAITFLGLIVIVILKLLDKASKIVPLLMMGIGALALIILVISTVQGSDYLNYLSKNVTAASAAGKDSITYKATSFTYKSTLYDGILNYVIFALGPIAYGLKLLFRKK